MKKAARIVIIISMALSFPLIYPLVFGLICLQQLEYETDSEEIRKWGIACIFLTSIPGGILMLNIKENELAKPVDYYSLNDDELSKISEKDHHNDIKQYDVQQNSLAFVVLGGIALVCGILFLILSFRRVMNKLRGIDTASLQFFVCIACFVLAAGLLSIGLTRFIIATVRRTRLRREIAQVSIVRKELISQEK